MTLGLPELIGMSTYADAHTDPTTPVAFSLAIPTGTPTQPISVGDLLVASIITKSPLVPPGRGLLALHTSSDWVDLTGASWNIGVYAGPWDGDPSPIEWQGSGFASPVGQFYAALLASFHDRIDPSRTAVSSNGPTVAGLPGEGPSIAINWVRAVIAGDGGFHPFEGTTWSPQGAADATYVLGTLAINEGAVGAQTATDSGDIGGDANVGRYVVFGVVPFTIAPPCRLYPREDQLGVGSGRIWPPPKSQQFSNRRAGGYY